MLKVLELFAGIGACSKALENLGVEHEIVDAVEIDEYAIKSFNAIHGTNFEPQNITKWDKNIDADLIMHGSPCQDFSLAGKQAGGDEGSGTRSSLMYETLRIVKKLKPKYVIWENVKNILSKRHRHNFDAYQEAMANLGYSNYYKVLNAKDYGVPQNRERVFTVSILGNANYVFPKTKTLSVFLKDIVENDVDKKYYLNDRQMLSLSNTSYKQNKRFYGLDGCSPTLNTMGGGQREPKISIDDGASIGEGAAKTLSTEITKEILGNVKIRKLTPKECWRLMGFDDSDFKKAEKINSNSQLYKQAGNSIVVDVLMGILGSLLNG